MSDELTIDQAAALLTQGSAAVDTASEDTGALDATTQTDDNFSQDNPDPEIDAEPAPPEETSEDGDDDQEQIAPQHETSEAPFGWSAEEKDLFAKMPPEAQQVVLAHAEVRNKAVSDALEKSANARKAAEAEAEQLSRQRSELEKLLPKINDEFAARWTGADDPSVWVQAFQTDPAQAAVLKVQYEAELQQKQKLEEHARAAEEEARKSYLKGEAQRLIEMAPSEPIAKKLVGPDRLKFYNELSAYMTSNGIPAEDQGSLPAVGLVLVAKAMERDRALAKADKQPSAQTKQASPGTRMRPPATSGQTQPHAKVKSLENRLNSTGSVDDAVALYLAMKR